MVDIPLSVRVNRTALGLSDLDLNDHINYYMAASGFLGGQVTYERNQISSPFIDGGVTVHRHKSMVTENLTVEVLGLSYPHLLTQIQTLVDAFSQDQFNMQIAWNGKVMQYVCEAADYTVNYATERWANQRVQVAFSIPRQPTGLNGGF